MRQITAALLFLSVPLVAQEQPAGDAVRALEAALRDGGEEERIDAIRAHGRVADDGVVKLLATASRDPARAVRREAIDALGWNPSARALDELTSEYWKNTAIRADGELFALLLKSIGRHGDPKSIPVLTDSPFRSLTLANGTARLMGLGNIRSAESVSALVDLSKRAAPGRGKGGGDRWPETFGPPFRVALAVLTGQDLGMSRAAWQKWWGESGKGFEVASERPAVPSDVSEYFERFWDVPYGPGGEKPAAAAKGSPHGWIEQPASEQVKAAVEDLRTAFSGGKDDEIIAAIEASAGVNDPDVVRLVAKGLSSRSTPVRIAAIDALGWAKGKDALRQLHRLYHRDKDLAGDEQVFAALLKAIGRHGDKSSIEVLSDSPFKGLTVDAGRARILGLANIRDTRSVEELVKGMRLGGGDKRGRRTTEPVFLEDFRLAFAVLTGVDCGASREAMDSWWRENKGFKVAPARPPVPPPLQERWERYWGTPY